MDQINMFTAKTCYHYVNYSYGAADNIYYVKFLAQNFLIWSADYTTEIKAPFVRLHVNSNFIVCEILSLFYCLFIFLICKKRQKI